MVIRPSVKGSRRRAPSPRRVPANRPFTGVGCWVVAGVGPPSGDRRQNWTLPLALRKYWKKLINPSPLLRKDFSDHDPRSVRLSHDAIRSQCGALVTRIKGVKDQTNLTRAVRAPVSASP